MFLESVGHSDEYYIDSFIAILYKLKSDLQLTGLRKSGLSENEVRIISSETEIKNNPVKLAEEDLAEILLSSL